MVNKKGSCFISAAFFYVNTKQYSAFIVNFRVQNKENHPLI